MFRKFIAFTLFICLFCTALAVMGQIAPAGGTTPSALTNDPRFIGLEELKPGMKGVAYSVFKGTVPEEFGVEVLGILPGYPNPRQSAIIIKLSGANAERTGVFAGMSGSPVYFDGRLAGAIAFSFPFSKEPIGGVTPIKQMIDLFAQGGDSSDAIRHHEPRAYSFSELAATEWKGNLPKPAVIGAPMLANVSGGSPLLRYLGQQIAPIATPVIFGGISQQTLEMFAPQLMANGLMPVAAAGGGMPLGPLGTITPETLKPGTSITAALVRGDYSLAASGTVTFRDGDRIYAFGHPFLSLGGSSMPMAESSVVTVVPNTNNSFKLTIPGAMVGSITQDRASGIYGQLRQAPRMIPVTIKLRTTRNQDQVFNYEVMEDQTLTPLLLNLTLVNTLGSSERTLGDSTITISGNIALEGQSPVVVERRFSANNANALAAGSIALPVSQLLASGFDNTHINKISIDINSEENKHEATLDRVALNRTEVHRGDQFEIQAFVRSDAGQIFVQRIPVSIPADIPPGQVLLFVGDGASLQQASASQSFVPANLGQLVNAMNQIKKNDRLYVKLYRVTPGAIIGTSELPNLPPSMLATLNSDRSMGGITPTILSPFWEKELPAAEFVISGQQVLALDVLR
jgi:hypothetical protein